MRLGGLAAGAWAWPSWGSALETRRARRESGRSLNVSAATVTLVTGGRRGFFLQAVV